MRQGLLSKRGRGRTPDPHLAPHTQVSSKWAKDLNVGSKTTEL